MSGHGVPHHSEKQEHRSIGIFISVLAVFMAVVSSLAKKEANEMILREVKASNGFAWYQSKRGRSYLNELEIGRIDRELAGNPSDAQRGLLGSQKGKLQAKNAEYEAENAKILVESEADRQAAELAGHRHHRFEYAEISLHVAVVLASIALLTDDRKFFWLGLAATAAGVALAVSGFLIQPHSSRAHTPTQAPAASSSPASSGH